MREVFEVDSDKARQAEQMLREDDFIGRQSIAVRNPGILGMDGDEVYIIINGSEESIEKAKEMLKDIAKVSEKRSEVLEKFDELEDKTADAFGSILG